MNIPDLKNLELQNLHKKDPEVRLPSHIFLTPAGLKFIRSNSPAFVAKKFNNISGISKEGFYTKSFNAQAIQKMAMKFFIDEIYVALPELLSLRSEIISTNNLIVYSILYRKLTPTLAKTLFESKVVKDFNRKNPKNSMVNLANISLQKVEMMHKQYGNEIEKLKEEIRERVTEKILSNTSLKEEDMYARIRALPKFINWIDPRVWFLFFVIYKTEFKEQIQITFVQMIYNYLEHTVIATHLSNLIMEFIQNSEKSHYTLLATKYLGIKKSEVDNFIRSRKNREALKLLAIEKKQSLEISWNLNPEKIGSMNLSRLLIMISNYGLIDEETTQKLRRKMKADIDGISIASFYDDLDPAKLGAGLGLLYNSYLEDICRKEGISYRCVIYPEPSKQKTTVKIDMTL